MDRAILYIAIKSSGLFIAIFILFFVGYGNKDELTVTVSSPPDAAEILKLDPNADIFQWENAIYQTKIEWVDDLDLVEHEQIGEIHFEAFIQRSLKMGLQILCQLELKFIQYMTETIF